MVFHGKSPFSQFFGKPSARESPSRRSIAGPSPSRRRHSVAEPPVAGAAAWQQALNGSNPAPGTHWMAILGAFWIGLIKGKSTPETHGFLPSNMDGFPVKIVPSSNSMIGAFFTQMEMKQYETKNRSDTLSCSLKLIVVLAEICWNFTHGVNLGDHKSSNEHWLMHNGDMGLSENRVYSQWNSHLIGIMIINHWV